MRLIIRRNEQLHYAQNNFKKLNDEQLRLLCILIHPAGVKKSAKNIEVKGDSSG